MKIFQPGPGVSCLFMAFWVFSSEMNVGQKHSSPLTHVFGTTSVMSSSKKMTPENVWSKIQDDKKKKTELNLTELNMIFKN